MKRLITTCLLAGAFAAAAAPELEISAENIRVAVAAGEVSVPSGVILCWGDEDGGETVATWEHSYVMTTNGVTAAGWTNSVAVATLGIKRYNRLRVFIVPGELKRVEYIASDQAQLGNNRPKVLYIDTGVRCKSGLRVETEMMWLELSDCEYCGGRYTSGDSSRMFLVHTYQNKWFQGYGSHTKNDVTCEKDRRYYVDSRLYNGYQNLKVVDLDTNPSVTNTVNDTTWSGAVDTAGYVYLLAAHYPYLPPAGAYARARCKSTRTAVPRISRATSSATSSRSRTLTVTARSTTASTGSSIGRASSRRPDRPRCMSPAERRQVRSFPRCSRRWCLRAPRQFTIPRRRIRSCSRPLERKSA